MNRLPITVLRGVGTHLRDRLARIGIHGVQDLLFHLPTRYLDRTRITPIAALRPLAEVVIEGEVLGADVVQGRRRSLICKLGDRSGVVTLRFFHFSAGQRNALTRGTRLRCYGEVRLGPAGLELYHPEYQALDATAPAPLEQSLTPVYPAGEGVTQARLRQLITQALALAGGNDDAHRALLRDWLPASVRPDLPPLADAVHYLHAPPPDAPLVLLLRGEHPAQRRLAFEELLAHHLSLQELRARVRSQRAPILKAPRALEQRFLDSLPFTLTGAQQRVCREIAADLAAPVPMLRLLQGDVGSGKTAVAAHAVMQAVGAGFQASLMAPTEILAEQHRDTLEHWLRPLGIHSAWLTGRLKGRARAAQLAAIADGSARLAVGTHALFQDEVTFARLGLTIIDEQHRFGVHQRLSLREKGCAGTLPHQLIMTATPIPRTLAMIGYADLDYSVIDELPPGRQPVNTVAIANRRRAEVIARIHGACRAGRQAYWVCTLIEDSEVLQAQAAETAAAELTLALPDLRIGLVHGRMKSGDKAAAMAAFKAGNIDLLVATTVIEVGVDVPKATLMVIENPERLGLAQLHQLRGRVGRGETESHCVLLYGAPLSQHARERLRILRETNDGFVIAERDLQLRGPGEVLGTRQTGDINLRIADLQRDADLLAGVQRSAATLMADYPETITPLIQRWLGHATRYGEV
ncbi:MAG: ATP-dependent DNA helicase RecG [Porticoccaceae bacterium]